MPDYDILELSGHKAYVYQVTDSTNTRLKALARDGESHGSIAAAYEQTSGRGRMDRKWLSRSGLGAWFSYLIRPEPDTVPSEKASDLVFVSALSMARALSDFSVEAQIKWPNDLVIGGKKICGIMCEMAQSEGFLTWAVAGIGVNLLGCSFPPDLPWAASVESETGVKIAPLDLIARFLPHFDNDYRNWLENGLFETLQNIAPLSATLGNRVVAHLPNGEITGIALRFRSDGALIIQTENGECAVAYGDVSVRGVMGYT